MVYFRKIKKKLYSIIFFLLNRVCIICFPLKKDKVCFLSDVRNVLGGNLKFVYDYLENKNYERVIEFRADRRIKRTFRENIQLVYNLSTSKYILLDDYVTVINYVKVRKNQELVQLWHGPGAFKKFGWSRAKTNEPVGNIHKGYKKYTKATVSSFDIRGCYAEAFSICIDKVKATGFPRTDSFFDKNYIKQTKENFYSEHPKFVNKKMILFAPTYRGTLVKDATYDFSQINFDKIYNAFHEEYIFVIKWHPALYNNIKMGFVNAPDLSRYEDFYKDFSEYRDINDLLIVTDFLITDYSSLIFDYVLLDKPIAYFAYDLEEYSGKGGRGLYYKYDEYIYGDIVKNTDEIIDAILNPRLMEEKRKRFYNKFMGECDGHSTEKTCQWIFND